ncbi:alpha/beta hydrolase [Flectobacillus sp. BAB-3569]|uniref:alpha/beta hydrolase n=1 Tax=Flectobacillus sp. BAB-3569 TaxID=1509483 RepID=UPI000BA310D4|nr:alpha/beta hydrolase [Flectobacillus sp. BAB-3569]PAC30741.1 homoserine acetyltransferase [Flectobacillus sp. BAB-3569]
MKKILFLLLCGLANWATAQQKFYHLGDFKLENGQVIKDCKIGYRTFGKLNASKSNAVLVPTWFTGNSQQKSFVADPKSFVDSTKYFVIIVDALGNGVSSSPSNSTSQKNQLFPTFNIRDMVVASYKLSSEHLKLSHLYAVTGISMGGMQTFQWMLSYPDYMDKIVPIIGSPQQSSYDKLFWNLQLNLIERGNYSPEAMASVNALHQMHLWTPSYRAQNTPTTTYPELIGKLEKEAQTLNAYDWASQLRAMLQQDIYQGKTPQEIAPLVKAKVMILVAPEDQMVNPLAAIQLSKILKCPLVLLEGNCGHMATSCQSDQMIAHIKGFLDK